MSVTIRLCTEADFEALAGLLTVIFGQVHTAEGIRYETANIDPRCKWQRWVAEAGGQIVGSSAYWQFQGAYHPQKFWMTVVVHPDHRGRGIGTALYDAALADLQQYDPILLEASVRENWPEGIRFAGKRGFTETMRTWESHLDLTTADFAAIQDAAEQAAALGYSVKSYAELEGTPDMLRKLYELVREVRRDIPSTQPRTEIPFEQWAKFTTNPHFWPEGYCVAMKGDEWVGVSTMSKTDEEGLLHTGITAVKREHRGTGVAKLLKLHALHTAKEAGFRKIKTWNESNNQRMLAINRKLGFETQPAWIALKKDLV